MRLDTNKILDHYLEAALWSSLAEDEDFEYLDQFYSIADVSDEVKEQSLKDIEAFVERADTLLEGIDEELIGHDLWLTRNGHGAGFWDRGYGEIGEQLTDIADDMGEVYLFGDGETVHFM